METKTTIKSEEASIRSWGMNIVWRNSTCYRYLRVNLFLGKRKYQYDFFRKDKFL